MSTVLDRFRVNLQTTTCAGVDYHSAVVDILIEEDWVYDYTISLAGETDEDAMVEIHQLFAGVAGVTVEV